MGTKQVRKDVLKYLIELLIVAFGVFLGFYVSEWKSNQRVVRNTSQAIANIIEELEINETVLLKSIKYHEKIKENLWERTQTFSQAELRQPYFGSAAFHLTEIEGWVGVGLPAYESIAFEGAKMNGVLQEIDIETVQAIAGAYSKIEFCDEFGKSLFEKMIQMNSETKVADVVGMLELLTSDILTTEITLAFDLKKIIAEIKADLPKGIRDEMMPK
jgi:hypothetical protein